MPRVGRVDVGMRNIIKTQRWSHFNHENSINRLLAVPRSLREYHSIVARSEFQFHHALEKIVCQTIQRSMQNYRQHPTTITFLSFVRLRMPSTGFEHPASRPTAPAESSSCTSSLRSRKSFLFGWISFVIEPLSSFLVGQGGNPQLA